MTNSKEAVLGSLITDELRELNPKLKIYGKEIKIPGGGSWKAAESLTLLNFLRQHPEPDNPEQIPLYGIAWELAWGLSPPESIVSAREALLTRNRFGVGRDINDLEDIWLKLIACDVELF